MQGKRSKAFKQQTIQVEPGTANHSPVYRANPDNFTGDKITSKLYKAYPSLDQVDTLYAVFHNGYNQGPTNRCLGKRPHNGKDFAKQYEWITYEQVDILRTALGSGIHYILSALPNDTKSDLRPDLKLPPEATETIGIISVNRPEWTIFDLACAAYAKINVPIYDTFGEEAIEYIINHSNLSMVFASADKLPTILSVAKRCPCLKVVVCLDVFEPSDAIKQFLSLDNAGLSFLKTQKVHPPTNVAQSAQLAAQLTALSAVQQTTLPVNKASLKDYLLLLRSWADASQIQFYTFDQVLHMGRAHPLPHMIPKPQDVATISYTSGTTGFPKGAVLTHLNFASTIQFPYFAGFTFVPEEDCLISYLPLAHIFGRVCELAVLVSGGRVGYYSGDVLRIVEDIQILQPTFFPSVPRLLNRIYIQIQEATVKKSGIIGYLFRQAFATKLEGLKHGENWHTLVDNSPLFSRLRGILGGRLRVIITGSAPIDDTVLTFLRACFGCIFVQGYGQTETCAGSCVSLKDDFDAGHTGIPIPCNEIRLESVPEMKYTVQDKPFPRGEILYRGYNVFVGYWRDPAKTKEVFKDGWLCSGDIGSIDKYGRLRIIDRKKNIFKLAQGEYVAVEKIEGVYAKNSNVMQLFIYGDSLESYLVAIVVPNPAVFAQLAQKTKNKTFAVPQDVNKAFLDPVMKELCNDPDMVSAVYAALDETGKAANLKGFEYIKKIYLSSEPFTIENGLMTPSFKTKRNEAKVFFQSQIKRMYGK